MKLIWLALLSVACSGAGQLLLRKGASSVPAVTAATVGDPRLWAALLLNGYVLCGLAAWTASTLLWLLVLNRAAVSYVYLLGALNYVLVPLLGRWLFNERMSSLQLIGMAIICIGVAMVLVGRR